MANQRRGLGRGLNSLLGESMGEVGYTQPQKKEEKPQPAPEPKPEPKVEKKSEPAPAEHKVKATLTAEVTEQAAHSATIKERPANPQVSKPQPPRRKVDEYTNKAIMEGDVAKPKPYIEEPDHAEIKGVVVREPRKPVEEKKQTGDIEVPLASVQPNPDQPRTNFNKVEIEELAQSIKREGLLQPILVRKYNDGYQIIAGERRWQACKSLGMKEIPIRIKDVADDKALELALIENIQRSDLNPIEEAYGYKRLMERKNMTQSDVAQAVSKGRSTIANALRLLELPEDAQQLLFEEKITAGHARAILSVPTKEGRQKLTNKLRDEKLSVRETEALARLYAGQAQNNPQAAKRVPTPASFKKAARGLRERLHTNVRIKTVRGKNKIEIEFKDEDELQALFSQIMRDDL